MDDQLLRWLAQLPIVAIFLWYVTKSTKDNRIDNKEREEAMRAFVAERDKIYITALDKLTERIEAIGLDVHDLKERGRIKLE